jgi:ABC-2 type transport system permease protein
VAASSALSAPPATGASAGLRHAPASVLARRAFSDARVRTIAFGYLFAIYAYVQPAGYRSAYPTLADRLAFAHSFAATDALRLLYGYPYDPVTVAGYCAWRVAGTLAIAAALFGVLAAVRALRSEEDAGRMELILAGAVGRATVYASAMAAIAAGVLVLWLAEFAGSVAGGLPVGGSAYMALSTASVAPVFVGLGALTSQLAPTRRIALELGSGLVGLFLLLRVIADTSPGLGWLRWATPLGWAEQLRPFTGARPAVLLLPVAASSLVIVAAGRIARGRDTGTGLLPARETAAPRLRLLSSPTAQALRTERGSLIAWASGIAAFALILGTLAASISSAGISSNIRREIAKLGSGSIATPTGYLAFVFVFFILAVSVFVCGQVAHARQEEAGQRLETLLSQPVGRIRWLGGRLLLAAVAGTALSLLAGLLTWAGAASQGVSLSLARMLEAGANCLPVALLFLGLASLGYAIAPRASAGIAYGLVTIAFIWDLLGSLLDVPKWLVKLTPFAHVGLVPAQAFRGEAAAIMVALGVAAAAVALGLFRHRDMLGA